MAQILFHKNLKIDISMITLKKILTGAFLFISVITVMKAQPTSTPDVDPNAPVLKFEKDTVFYGTIENKADGWRVLKIKNTGKSPLIIQNVHGECGCTTADSSGKKTWTTDPIPPGKGGYIKVHYATERTGAFSKKVFVDSNSQDKTMEFYIKGEVLAPGVKAPAPAVAPKKKPATIKKMNDSPAGSKK
jgi:hypothetical protein